MSTVYIVLSECHWTCVRRVKKMLLNKIVDIGVVYCKGTTWILTLTFTTVHRGYWRYPLPWHSVSIDVSIASVQRGYWRFPLRRENVDVVVNFCDGTTRILTLTTATAQRGYWRLPLQWNIVDIDVYHYEGTTWISTVIMTKVRRG